jgi:hypothetical protein
MSISKGKLAFWILIVVILTISFGSFDGDYSKAFLFVTFLMPAALGTSFLINSVLIPKYLLKQRYFKFGLYLFYTLVISLYLEMVAVILGLTLLANYQYQNLGPYTQNIFFLTITLYFIVLLEAFGKLLFNFQQRSQELRELEEKEARNSVSSLIVKSNRETVSIPINEIFFIESLSDYVKIYSEPGEVLTKERISRLPDRLTDDFIRIHRSFLVNKNYVESFTAQYVVVRGKELPVGRKFKESALNQFGMAR